MSDLLKDIKNYLISKSIDTEGNIFLDFLPPSPDNLLVIHEYQGGPGSGKLTERRIQIECRNSNSITGKSLINSIRNTLDDESPEQTIILNTNRTTVFKALQEPYKLGIDDKKRIIYVCNFRVITNRD